MSDLKSNGVEIELGDAYDGQRLATVTLLLRGGPGHSFGHNVRVHLTVEQDDELSIRDTHKRVLDRARSILQEAHTFV